MNEASTAVRRVFLYLRKSTKDEAERQIRSIGDQRQDCIGLAERLGLEIIDEFTEDRSASRPNNRPIFRSMLKELSYKNPKRRRADAVLAWHPDRLSRNALEAGMIVQMLDDEQIKMLYFPAYQFHNDTSGKEHLTIEFARAKGYTDRLSEVVVRGVTGREQEGAMIYPAKYGYMKLREVPENPQKCSLFPIPHPESFEIVQRMFALALDGAGIKAIRAKLIAEFPERRKHILSLSAIDARLRDPFYCGHWLIKPGSKQERVIDLTQICLPNGTKFMPVLSVSEFHALQEARKIKSNAAVPRRTKRVNPLPNLVTCGKCGGRMYPNHRKVKRAGGVKEEQLGYECQNRNEDGTPCCQRRVKADIIFETIQKEIETFFPRMTKRDYQRYVLAVGAFIKQKEAKAKSQRSRINTSLEKIKTEKRRIIHQRAELIAAGEYDKHSKAHYEARLEELSVSESDLKNERKSAQYDSGSRVLRFKQFMELMENLHHDWPAADCGKKAALSKTLFWNLTVHCSESQSVRWNSAIVDAENGPNFDSGRPAWNQLEPYLERWWNANLSLKTLC